jgi:hypothetical protein
MSNHFLSVVYYLPEQWRQGQKSHSVASQWQF